jgi:hypothetical protein
MSTPEPALKEQAEVPKMSWSMSPTIGKLVEAIAKASLKFDPVLKDADNPAYRSKYADLPTIIEATRKHLAAEGVAVIQMPHAQFGSDEAKMLTVTTMLAHTSGEWMASDLTLPAMMRERFDAQSVGSAVTYARRYSLAAMTNVAQEDDDGNKASGVGSKQEANAVAGDKLRKAAAKKGDDAVALTEWKEGFVAVSGGGLAVVKAEIEAEELKGLGFKLDGNVVTIPAANAFAFEDMCKRANVPVHWAQSAKKAANP